MIITDTAATGQVPETALVIRTARYWSNEVKRDRAGQAHGAGWIDGRPSRARPSPTGAHEGTCTGTRARTQMNARTHARTHARMTARKCALART